MLAEKTAAFLMKNIMRVAMMLMAVGLLLLVFKINTGGPVFKPSFQAFIEGFKSPTSTFFFSLSAGLLLLTPVLVSFNAGVLFIADKQPKMSLVSFALFSVLMVSIFIKLLAS